VIGHSALGGAVPIVLQVCEVCRELDLSPVVLASHPDVIAYFKDAGQVIWEFPGIVREPRPIHDFLTACNLGRELAARGTQVVHTHTSKGGMVGRLAGRLGGCDLVIHHTHGFYHSGLGRGVERAGMMGLEWAFSHASDFQLFVNSADRKEAVDRRFLPGNRAVTLFNGVDDPLKGPRVDAKVMRSIWGVPTDARVIGLVARIAERKGVDTCLRAFQRLMAAKLDVWLVVLGKGSEFEAMQHLAESLGISGRVQFVGHVPNAGRYFNCFDLAVTASEHEGQSISVIEAISCGTPVVASDIRGHRDMVIDGVTGLLCPVGDDEAFARAIAGLLADPTRLSDMSRNARSHYMAHFTSARFRDEVASFYRMALSTVALGHRDSLTG